MSPPPAASEAVVHGSASEKDRADWTPPFREAWRSDLGASVVVFLVALPLCLGVALASGAPLFSGIVTGIVGGIVVGVLSGSQLAVSGPAAGLTAIVLSAITALGSFEAFLVAVVLAGGMQIGLGLLRAGVIGYYLPNAVIRGMLGGIGIIIILKQLPYAVGYHAESGVAEPGNVFDLLSLTPLWHRVHGGALALSALSMGVLVLWDQPFMQRVRLIPGPLVAVVLGVGLNALAPALVPGLAIEPRDLVALPEFSSIGDVTATLASPAWAALSSPAVWKIAVTIAVVASLETLLSLEATDRIDPLKREAPANRELVAQGVGNAVAGLLGGIPMTSVIVRSSANVYAGGKTKASTIFHGIFLLLAVVAIPGLLNRIPLAVLAAVLIYTGWKLAHPRNLMHFLTKGFRQWLPFTITTAAILATDLLVGILVGLGVSLVFILLEHLQTPCYTVVLSEGRRREIRLHPQLTFLSKANLSDLLQSIPNHTTLVLDGTSCTRIDHDVLEIIREFRETAPARSIAAEIKGIDLGTTEAALAH